MTCYARTLRVLAVLLLLCLPFLGARTASGQITSQTGAVNITVVDRDAGAVSGAKVTLSSDFAPAVTKQITDDGSSVGEPVNTA